MLTAERTVQRVRRIYFGWIIVGVGLIIQALQSALVQRAFGLYFPLLQSEFGWSKTTTSAAVSLQQVESGLLGPLQGWLIDRFGARRTMRVGIIIFGLGFLLFSRTHNVLTFYASFILIAIGSSLGGFMPLTVTVVNWFVRKRASALATMQYGMAVGAIFLPLIAYAMTTWGWRPMAVVSGVIIIVVGVPLTTLMRPSPEQYGLLPDGDLPGQRVAAGAGGGKRQHAVTPDGDFTVGQALRTPAFWLISGGHGSALLVVQAVQVHFVQHLNESLGYSLQKGASILTLLTMMTFVGQSVGGYLGDRISKRAICFVCMLGHAIALLAIAYATGLPMVLFGSILHGLAWGARGPLMQAIRADYFGVSSFGKIMGFSSVITTIGSITGPLLAGIMADQFGNYRAGFTILAVLAGMGSLFWVFARRPRPPASAPAESPAG